MCSTMYILPTGLLPYAQNCALRMRRECRERFPRHLRVSDPDMRDARAMMHVRIAS